jgi:hypothetical protein
MAVPLRIALRTHTVMPWWFRLANLIDPGDVVAHCVALYIEPTAAAVGVHPLLQVAAFDVAAMIKILTPLFIGNLIRLRWACDMRLPTATEFAFSSWTAKRTIDF